MSLIGMCMRGYAALPLLLATAVVVTSGAIAATLLTGEDQLALRAQQQEAVARVEDAVLGFLVRNARLPCPDTTGNGLENCPSATNPAQAAGEVPYRTLGLSGSPTRGLLYAPYIGNGDPAFNLTDASLTEVGGDAVNDVVRIELPDELPDLGGLTLSPERTDFGDLSDLDRDDLVELLDLLAAVQAYNKFLADLVTNNPAISWPGFFPGLPVPNAISGNYISAFSNALSPVLPAASGSLAFVPGNEVFDRLVVFAAALQIFRRSVVTNESVYDHAVRMQLFQLDLGAIIVNTSLTEAQKVTQMAAIRNQWIGPAGNTGLVGQHNAAVNAYAASFDDYGVTQLEAELNNEIPTLQPVLIDTTNLFSTDFVTLCDALEVQMAAAGNTIQQNISGLDGAVQGSYIFLNNESGALISLYEVRRGNVISVRNVAQLTYDSEDCAGTPSDPALCASLLDQINEYNAIISRLNGLISNLENLYGDLYCRAIDGDDNCITDSFQDQYLDAIDALLPDDDVFAGAPAPICEPNLPPINDPNDPAYDPSAPLPPDAFDDCAEDDGSITLPSEGISVSPTNYPTLVNVADFCFKLDSIGALVGAPALGYAQSGVAGPAPAAFLLVEYGSNQRLDTPNVFPGNGGVFAEPDRPHNLQYDDRVRPMTVGRLSIMLGCPALLQSYRSFGTTAEEINLLYLVAKDSLDGAERDVITAGITLALATIRLAVDTAAVIKDTTGGIAATVTCVASLGLAANACASAGLQFSAAAAHGATLIGDAAALAQAIVDLETAISDRASARDTLEETVDHFTAVVQAALETDNRGGVRDATE